MSDDLGPKPDAAIEPGEPNPGGVDAVPEDEEEVVPADVPIEDNPAVDTTSTPTLTEREDTSTAATTASRGPEEDTESETVAEDPA